MAHRRFHRHDKCSVVLEARHQVAAHHHQSSLDLWCFRSTLGYTLAVELVGTEDCIVLHHDQKVFSLPILFHDMAAGPVCDDGERS